MIFASGSMPGKKLLNYVTGLKFKGSDFKYKLKNHYKNIYA